MSKKRNSKHGTGCAIKFDFSEVHSNRFRFQTLMSDPGFCTILCNANAQEVRGTNVIFVARFTEIRTCLFESIFDMKIRLNGVQNETRNDFAHKVLRFILFSFALRVSVGPFTFF